MPWQCLHCGTAVNSFALCMLLPIKVHVWKYILDMFSVRS